MTANYDELFSHLRVAKQEFLLNSQRCFVFAFSAVQFTLYILSDWYHDIVTPATSVSELPKSVRNYSNWNQQLNDARFLKLFMITCAKFCSHADNELTVIKIM